MSEPSYLIIDKLLLSRWIQNKKEITDSGSNKRKKLFKKNKKSNKHETIFKKLHKKFKEARSKGLKVSLS